MGGRGWNEARVKPWNVIRMFSLKSNRRWLIAPRFPSQQTQPNLATQVVTDQHPQQHRADSSFVAFANSLKNHDHNHA